MDMTIERKASELVEREVLCCLSTMMYEIREVAEKLDDYDTYLNLQSVDDDYEPARDYILDEADFDELEAAADEYGYWSDVLFDIGYQTYVSTCEESDEDPDDVEDWIKSQDECHTADESFTKALRKAVWALVEPDAEGPAWVCNEFGLDPHVREVYEHWAVSSWFGRKLEGRGERVEEYLGLRIWGRCTTGQSISIDSVIQAIAKDLLGDQP